MIEQFYPSTPVPSKTVKEKNKIKAKLLSVTYPQTFSEYVSTYWKFSVSKILVRKQVLWFREFSYIK